MLDRNAPTAQPQAHLDRWSRPILLWKGNIRTGSAEFVFQQAYQRFAKRPFIIHEVK